ncbi:membrane lipoprotein lipid attachment site-containing protein [Desulfosarcina ovata]|uniref:Lipoprotein n=1 Tax=Desulfosarcina ovata subsp. ovata TaxID=2752305 RepID=A0A5K8A757_9BACT|nr:membrane lipoprotein lipid attachment site-containing protein [Desulfosarcina ovata]BBO87970.1 hypothetical protein DSCOOX_11500 [Desulfosarcina ovata subsp. ovata]
MKRIVYAIVIVTVLIGCAKHPVTALRNATINVAEPRVFHGSDIIDCKINHQQHRQRED